MLKSLEPAEIAAIRKRCEAATKGPWSVNVQDHIDNEGNRIIGFGVLPESHGGRGEGDVLFARKCKGDYTSECSQARQNREFIAHARIEVPKLLDEVERLQQACSLAHGALVAAVATDDGLDGDDGLTVIRKIEKIMPSLTARDIDEHGTDAQSTQVQPEA